MRLAHHCLDCAQPCDCGLFLCSHCNAAALPPTHADEGTMGKIERCDKCGGNVVTPAFDGDGVYPVGRMCECARPTIDLMKRLQHHLGTTRSGLPLGDTK